MPSPILAPYCYLHASTLLVRCAMQLDLLKRLSWRVRLDFEREVVPCKALLFPPPEPAAPALFDPRMPFPASGSGATPAPGLGLTSAAQHSTPSPGYGGPTGMGQWCSLPMEMLCSGIEGHAAALAAGVPPSALAAIGQGCSVHVSLSDAKRVRLA
jgi:hypothetical protein